MNRHFLKTLVTLVFIFELQLYSQEVKEYIDSLSILIKEPVRIDSVFISGNSITDEDIILGELTFKHGDTVDASVLRYNRERIYSLEIFTRVNLIPHFNNGFTILEIHVEESWYIWPIPLVEIKEDDWKKISYGIQFEIRNFRGRNEKIKSVIALGYDPTFSLNYQIPYLFREEKISFQISLNYTRAKNKNIFLEKTYGNEFNQKFIYGETWIGKRLNPFSLVGLYTGYEYVETPIEVAASLKFNNRTERNFYLGTRLFYDTRDLVQFPTDGFLISFDYKMKGFGIENNNFSVFLSDIRAYKRIYKEITSKIRILSKENFGDKIPSYDYIYLGYDYKVRGRFGDKSEGNGLILTSFELRYPLIKEMNFSFELPIIPKSLLTYRIGIYTEFFLDAGAVRKRNEPLNFRDFMFGYGFGFALLVLPYNMARTIIAFNDHGDTQFELILGTSF